jgi:hypothetical protein
MDYQQCPSQTVKCSCDWFSFLNIKKKKKIYKKSDVPAFSKIKNAPDCMLETSYSEKTLAL